MADTVDVPGIKKPLPKWAVGGGIAVVGVLVFQYYRSKSSSAAAAAPAAGQYPADGTTGNPQDPYSTDPATGQTYGDESLGSGGTYGAYGSGGGYGGGYGGWDPNTGLYTDPNGNTCTNPGADGYCPGSGPGGPPFSSNSAWSNWVIQQMQSTNPNINTGALTDALGLYLAGQPVDSSQKTYILDAEAIGGPPPVAGPNGYPPKVRLNGHKGGHGGGTVQVPNVVGERDAEALRKLEAAGLKARTIHRKPGQAYHVTAESPKAGRRVAHGSTVHLTLKEGTARHPGPPHHRGRK